MPGYGVVDADQGAGLLPWSWARERLVASHDYWLATVRPDGRPHVMPVWGVWHADALLFSTSPASRKAKNLEQRCEAVVTTETPRQPVVVEGVADLVTDHEAVAEFTAMSNAKYDADYSVDFYVSNSTYRLVPRRVLALDDDDFTGTPTRWTFSS